MQIDPNAFYHDLDDDDALRPLGKRSTRAKHRHLGVGCPYIKSGARVIYKGADILDHLDAQRVEPKAKEW